MTHQLYIDASVGSRRCNQQSSVGFDIAKLNVLVASQFRRIDGPERDCLTIDLSYQRMFSNYWPGKQRIREGGRKTKSYLLLLLLLLLSSSNSR